MKLYTCYTDSHLALLEGHFLPSWGLSGLELVAPIKLQQRSSTGEFESDGFQQTCIDKVDVILQACATETEPFVFSDVDVRFYGSLVETMTKHPMQLCQMAFQNDHGGGACTGLMWLRPCEAVREFWKNVRSRMLTEVQMDQDAANRVINSLGARICYDILPDSFWTFGATGRHWEPGMPVNPPANLLVHHANWTKGIANKMELLEAVRTKVESMANPEAKQDADGVLRWQRDVKEGEEVTIQVGRDPKALIRSAVANIDAARPVAPTKPVEPQVPRIRPPIPKPADVAERYPFVASHARRLLDEQERQRLEAEREPDSLAIVLQFWSGDKDRALQLARLLADIEPRFREDVVLTFAHQETTARDQEIWDTMLYCGRKFLVSPMSTFVDERKTYPGIAYDPWYSAAEKVSTAYYEGRSPCENAFFIETDGVPLRTDWIDELKREHRKTLLLGKRITGPRMTFGGPRHLHINGTIVMHCSVIPDHPSLRRCPPNVAWDVFHGQVLINEAGPSQCIRNEYGGTDITASMFISMGKESCWLTSVKDESALGHAKSLLARRGRR